MMTSARTVTINNVTVTEAQLREALAKLDQLVDEGRLYWLPFAVGDWVQHRTQPWAKACKVAEAGSEVFVSLVPDMLTGWPIDQLRPATDAEIAEAKRIALKDNLLVRHKASGYVYQWKERDGWIGVAQLKYFPSDELTIDYYDILDSYLVQGATK